MTATAVALLLMAAQAMPPTAPPPWPGSVDGCRFPEAPSGKPLAPGRPSDLVGLRRVYVWSPASEVRQNIVNVLRRDLPQLVIVRTFDEAELILGFLVMDPTARGHSAERTGGWGVGCASYKAGPRRVVGAVAFDGRWRPPKSVLGAAFALQFVEAYQGANGAAKQ